jgi:hypothetical protein
MGPRTATVRAKHALICIASLLVLVPTAKSQSWTYGVDVGVGATDNVSLVPMDQISQTMAITDLDFTLRQADPRFDTDLKGDFTYLGFLQHAYSPELLGRFDGVAHLVLVPDRLTWALQDDFGQAQISPFSAPTPTNLENVDYLSTGPDLSMLLGSVGFLNLSARYARAQYQTSPFDNNRIFGSLSWGLQLSARSSLSLDGNSERVQFDDSTLNADYDRSSAYAHYEVHGARTDLVAKLGATELNQPGTSNSSPLIGLELTRKLSPAARLTLSAGRELTDAAASFSALQSGAIGAIITAPAAVTSASYTSTYASVGWRYERDRTTLGLSERWEKDSYEGQPLLDVSRNGAELKLQRKVTRSLSAELFGSLYYTDYIHENFTTDDGLVGAALTLREGRGLEFRLRYDHVSRVATGIGTGFRENIAFLTIGYRPQSVETSNAAPGFTGW